MGSVRARYAEFLSGRMVAAPIRGVQDADVRAPHLFPFQRECVEFGARIGSWGLFLDTGLGKTACELEWCRIAAEQSNGRALILTPLAVARQIHREGERWGYETRVIREQADAGDGVNICNYDRLDKLDPSEFGAIALDESSILKSFTGKTKRLLIASFAGHRWRLSATATPAPNDHMELGNQSEFLGVMSQADMLIRWYINDSGDTGKWRLKGHAERDFWNWMASWCRMAAHPADMGDPIQWFDLPPLRIVRHRVESAINPIDGELFATAQVSATAMHDLKRQTSAARADAAAAIVADQPSEPWVIWCDTNYESDAIKRALAGIPGVSDVRGSDSIESKEGALSGFVDGSVRVLITKPSICGWGVNWQHCARVIFVGRSFSYESWYQAVRRCWRFRQERPVDVHLIVDDGEESIGRVIERKSTDHERMKSAMSEAMRRNVGREDAQRKPYEPRFSGSLPSWITGGAA